VYLKQIELENFKSFGGKLTIPLMEGYLAVTGPNGSGKSNITDAILFVLGPKSSKAVRAGKLTDLIFDGGKGKGKAGFTKVSLVFDNTDRLMPWDEDIVRLTRFVKISDNGTDYSSYFYVNDRKSSLTEFDSLLTKARISADGYNMVQQGDVTRIVQMGNLERRRVLDGISGIASYDADIDKARGERLEAETNLDRINIVVEELVTQIERLEKDREDARKYIEAKNNLDVAKAQLTHRQLQIEESKLEGLGNQIANLTKEIETLTARKEELKQEHADNESAINAKQVEIDAKLGPEYKEIKDKIENARVAIATEKDRIERAEDDKTEQEEYKTNIEESISENLVEREVVSEELSGVVVKLESTEKQLNEAKDENMKLNSEISKQGGEHTVLQTRLTTLEADIDAKEKEEHDAEVRFAKAGTVSEELRKAKASIEERLQSADFEIKDSEWNLQQVKQQAGPAGNTEAISKQIIDSKRKEAEYERQENELKDAIRRLETQYTELAAEKKVTERANRGSAAVDAILALRDRGQASGIRGTIQELATVSPGYETALAVAAGGKMQAIVVNDDQTASDCISYLKKERLGRVTFLPLNKMVGGKPRAKAIMTEKQTEGYATDLIKYDPIYANAFWYVLQDTLVVATLAEARALMGGIRLVTKNGELIEASGAMVGGTISPQSIMKFGADSESKLDEVGSKLRAANTSLDLLRVQLRQLRDNIRALDDDMRKVSSAGIGIQTEMAQHNAKISELKKAKQALATELDEKVKEVSAAERELASARDDLAVLSESVENLRNERTDVRERITQIAPADVQERLQSIRDGIYRLNDEVSDLKTQKTTLETELSGIDQQRKSMEDQKKSAEKKIADDDAAIEEHTKTRSELDIELAAHRSIEREMEEVVKGLTTERDALTEIKYRLESEKETSQSKIEEKTGFRSTQEAQILIVNANIDQFRAEVAALNVEVPTPIPSEEELKRLIRNFEGTISRIGTVNLRAIEDYDEKKKRHDGLIEDVSNLNRQIKDLNDLTAALNAQKKGLFMVSYEAVDINFRAIYAQLSGGGEAFMALEDEEDPFVGGLTINAKPKNGKLLRLEALSGGEKSLTALAFIFAIQEYQPSPFYVLDEVDMFLDSVNAEMVAKRVKESSAKAQFIQVSLRKVTLAMADHLIGVTRPPSGISKVIIQPDLAEVSRYEEEALKKQETETPP
jgi:chromosome segregation protein